MSPEFVQKERKFFEILLDCPNHKEMILRSGFFKMHLHFRSQSEESPEELYIKMLSIIMGRS